MANITCNVDGIPANTDVAAGGQVTFQNGSYVTYSSWTWPSTLFTDGSTGCTLDGTQQQTYTTVDTSQTVTVSVDYNYSSDNASGTSSGTIKVGSGGNMGSRGPY